MRTTKRMRMRARRKMWVKFWSVMTGTLLTIQVSGIFIALLFMSSGIMTEQQAEQTLLIPSFLLLPLAGMCLIFSQDK